MVGSLIAYWIGAAGLLARLPGGRALVTRTERLLEDHGLHAVFIARLLRLARTFVSLPAGARRVPLIPFVALTTAGCALWATAFVIVGLLSGMAWSEVSSVLGQATLGVALVVSVAILVARSRRPR